jgi:hypothetical protein
MSDDDIDDDIDDESDDDGENDDDDDENEDPFEVTEFERTQADWSGVTIGDEFQPVDEVELSEEGMLLDDPERLAVLSDGADDPDGVEAPRRESLDPDDLGWEEDET